jgi:hypothetical protein
MNVKYTIYRYPTQHVGITFPPTPSITLAELKYLIGQLQKIATEMQGGEDVLT